MPAPREEQFPLYFFLPLNEHLDRGFGATADAFHLAAQKLDGQVGDRGPFMNEQLPIGFLFRHAIELYLKSAIVALHRMIEIPFGSEPPGGRAAIPVNGKWKPLENCHQLTPLWAHGA